MAIASSPRPKKVASAPKPKKVTASASSPKPKKPKLPAKEKTASVPKPKIPKRPTNKKTVVVKDDSTKLLGGEKHEAPEEWATKEEPVVAEYPTKETTLSDLCDSTFARKKNVKKLELTDHTLALQNKKNKDNTAAATSITNRISFTEKVVNDEHVDTGPRVEIVNGKIVLKESSLVVGEKESTIVEGEYEEIEEGIHATSRYSSFLIKKKSTPWGIEETRLFYQALRQCGTEFSIMQSFFPSRTRRELKLKLFREEKQHPVLVNSALEKSLPLEVASIEMHNFKR